MCYTIRFNFKTIIQLDSISKQIKHECNFFVHFETHVLICVRDSAKRGQILGLLREKGIFVWHVGQRKGVITLGHG